MTTHGFTIIDAGAPAEVAAHISGTTVCLAPDALRDALGLELKPEGLCKGSACFPVRDRTALLSDDGIDLVACAEVVARPLAIDVEARAAECRGDGISLERARGRAH